MFLAFCYILHEFPMFYGPLSSNLLEKGFEQCLTPRESQVIVYSDVQHHVSPEIITDLMRVVPDTT